MKQKLQIFTLIFFLCFCGFLIQAQQAPQYSNSQLEKKPYDEIAEEFKYLFDNSLVPSKQQHRKYLRREMFEYLQSAVPNQAQDLGNAMEEARMQTEQKIKFQKSARKTAGIPNVKWTERGPNNVGGRSRGLVYDPNDATARKVWTGGIAGGIFYNNNITDVNSAWQRVDLPEVISVTAICFDPLYPKTIYVGTGELSGGPNIPGGNIWKSVDYGKNWIKLPTNLGSWIKEIVVTKKGNIIASTIKGLQRSMDGGNTFTVMVGTSGGNTDVEIASDGVIYAGFDRGAVYKSNDDGATWIDLKTSETINQRIEIALAPSTQGDSQVIYAISGDIWFKKSVDGGKNWVNLEVPLYDDGTKYGSTQVTYNMTMSVHPQDPNFVWLGGTGIFYTLNGGKKWTQYGYWYIHPDQHNIIFSPLNNGEMILANDGGIHFSTQAANPQKVVADFKARNKDYTVTQFYSVAQRNVIGDNFLIGGAQDNSVINTNAEGKSEGRSVITGDGCFVFIDKDDPNMVISSTQNGNWYINDRSGKAFLSFSSGTSGAFVNPADYDSDKNILYANNGNKTFARCTNLTANPTIKQVVFKPALPAFVNALKIAKTSPNTIFMGTGNDGRIYKVTNIDKDTATTTLISSPIMSTLFLTTSNIDIGANDDEIIVTYSNFSTVSNIISVWYTNDGGKNWISKDEVSHGLPNVPIRWTLFNPENTKQVITATRLGVYSTNDITAENPAWELSSEGLALTDCRMMNYRPADGNIALATGGRGFYTTDIFAKKVEKGTINVNKMSVVSACADSTFDVHFTATGNFGSTNKYQVILSGEDGTFKNETLIGAGFTSPIRVTLPRALPLTFVRETALVSGNFLGEGKFKIKVVSSQPAFESENTQEFSLKAIQTALISNPSNTICKTDGAITIKAVAEKGAKFQWYKNVTNGTPILQKYTSVDSSALIVKSQSGAGSYFFKVTQNGCTNQSANRTVSYSTTSSFLQTASVSTFDDINKACEGKGVTLLAPLVDTTFFNYQWRRNGVNVATKVNLSNFQALESGSFDVSLDQKTSGCSFVYRPIVIKLQEFPVVTLTTKGLSEIKYGNSTTLNLTFNKNTYRPFEVTLSDNQKITVNDTLAIVTVSPKKTGTFKITSVSNLCGVGKGIGEAEIKVIPLILNSLVTDLKPSTCANSEVLVGYNIDGNPEKDNIYTVQLSDETGENFKDIVSTGTISPLKIVLPKDLKSGNRYRIRVIASNPAIIGKSSVDSLNIKALALGTVVSKDTTIFRFSPVPVSFTLTGESPWTIQTSDNQIITASSSPQILILKPTDTSIFSLKSVKDNLCGEGFVKGSTTITILTPLSAEEEANSIFNVFPNPTEANITIYLKIPSAKVTQLELIDLQGKILQKSTIKVGQNQETIDMEKLPAGTYMIRAVQDDKNTVKKVVKVR